MKKNLIFLSAICLTLSIMINGWLSKGFTLLGAAGSNFVMPLFWGVVVMLIVFEPFLLHPAIIIKISSLPNLELILRGVIGGILVFVIWSALYVLADVMPGYGLPLILGGLVAANAGAYFVINFNNKRKPSNRAKLAVMDRNVIERTFGKDQDWRQVEAKGYKRLDLDFYDNCQQELEAQGFRCLGDYEDMNLKGGHDDPKTFVRAFISADGRIQAGVYQPMPILWVRGWLYFLGYKLSKTYDLETEFSGGLVVVTNNATMTELMPSVPRIEAEYMPDNTTLGRLLEIHQEKIKKRERIPDVEVVLIRSDEEYWESQTRQHRLKMNFYKKRSL